MASFFLNFGRTAVAVCALGAFCALEAAVSMPAIFSHHMVLQRAANVPIWGTARPGEEISVTLESLRSFTKADAKGNWKVDLNLGALGQGPYTLEVKGDNEIVIKDVVIGQVWLASGQSNMAWMLENTTGGAAEVKAGAGNMVREFKIELATGTTPQADVKGKWIVAEPGRTGKFSGVAYFFAKRLNEELKQPVGIINSSWSGTAAEPWISEQTLLADKEMAAPVKKRIDLVRSLPGRLKEYSQKVNAFIKKNGLEDKAFAPAQDFAGQEIDTSSWKKIKLPATLSGGGFPAAGVVWLRREFVNGGNQPVVLQVQNFRGYATYYWNGKRVFGPENWTAKDIAAQPGVGQFQRVTIPAADVQSGKNVLAIRLYSPALTPGTGGPHMSARGLPGVNNLAGDGWLAKVEKAFDVDGAELAAMPRYVSAVAEGRQQPSFIFNGMISPIVPYAIAGVIWYQGESNAPRAARYRKILPMLIEDWRKQWNNPSLPFYFCQLANWKEKAAQPGDSTWAEVRDSQSKTLSVAKTGQAVLIDVGESEDIHPRDKKTVGERLSLLALANDYGRSELVSQGPVYEASAIVGNRVFIKFREQGEGSRLVANALPKTYSVLSRNNKTSLLKPLVPGSELQGFAICGADRKWVWAHARVETPHSIAVWSPDVPEPVAVRYGWADNPTVNLYNKAGLPASPFRTDDFPLSTEDVKYY